MRFFSADEKLDQLDLAIMDRVIADAARLKDRGHQVDRIAVNVSANLLFHPDFLNLMRSRIPKDFQLSLEFSETVSFEDLDTGTKMHLDSIRELGCSIEIDDFGRSQASLLGVIALGPDRIKIDKRIILAMMESEANQLIVKSILKFAKALEVEVIAEGVETQAHADALRKLGCNFGQGYEFSVPLRFDALTEFLARAEQGAKIKEA